MSYVRRERELEIVDKDNDKIIFTQMPLGKIYVEIHSAHGDVLIEEPLDKQALIEFFEDEY